MAVVLSEDNCQVLLLRREFFVLWDLPGGGIEKNEEPAEAAVRETHEETGYKIKVGRLVGRYLHQSVYGRGDQLTFAFRGCVVGGQPKRIGLETTGLRWFPIGELPRGLEPLHRQIIADAVADAAASLAEAAGPVAEAAGPVERQISFPRWKLYPARVVFFIVRWQNELLRKLLR